MTNYKEHVNNNGIVAFHVFVKKPFIMPPPEKEENSHLWQSGQLLNYFHDWFIEHFSEYVFDCNSSGIPHRHAANCLLARLEK